MAFLSIYDKEFWGRDLNELDREAQVEGLSRTNFALGKASDNAPVVRGLRMEPGFVLARHAHECHRFEVVVQGSMEANGRILKAGDIMISEPNTAYGPHVAGPEGCTTLEIFSTYDASHTILMESPTGFEKYDLWSPADISKVMDLARKQSSAFNK